MIKSKILNLVTIGYAKRSLLIGSRENLRMQKYASIMSELHMIVFTRQSEGFSSEQKIGNLFLYATNSKTRLGMLWSAYKIGRKIIVEDNKDWVVSSQDPFEASLVGRMIVRGNRMVHHVQLHGDVFNTFSYRTNFLARLRVIYGRYVVRRANCIRVVSDRLKKSLVLLGVKSKKISVLPIQSDITNFIRIGKKRVYDKDKSVNFLYVGRFSEEKNIPLLIRSFAEAVKDKQFGTLTLVGDGYLKADLKDLVSTLNLQKKVVFEDWTNDVDQLMSEFDVLCLSSNHEGWGMVLLEAAASGMGIVTTDVGCVGEIVTNENNGLVVPVNAEAAYINAISRYLNKKQLIADHGKNGYQVAKDFSLTEEEYLNKIVESYSLC